jgi:positive regulator of sigma E activity
MEYAEDIAVVKKVEKDRVTVEIEAGGGCKSCAMHSLCGGDDKTIRHTITTDMNLSVDDKVRLHISPGVKILSSFIIFIIPILAMILFYLIGNYLLSFKEEFAIVFSFVGLLISGIFIYLIDKKFAKKVHIEIAEKL